MIAEKLRKAILQAAMQGKLTEQLPQDGDARDLLAEIQQEKKQKIKAGEIKATKALPSVNPDEVPYEIPENWVWTRIGHVILANIGGGTPDKSNPLYWNGGIPWASVKDLNTGLLTTTKDQISFEGLTNSSTNLIPKGNIIICTRMGIGKIAFNEIDVAINQDLRALFLPNQLLKRFFYYQYLTLSFETKGATVKGISLEVLNNTLLSLPPLLEQKRIVGILETVLPLIDELEEVEKELDALEKEFPEKLKKSLLQAAMQGKLTEQLLEDGDARELLAEIQQEKKRKIKAGEIKAAKPLPPIQTEEIPYEIPENWVWTRLGEIGEIIGGGTPKTTKPEYWNSGTIEWITPADMKFNLGMFISGGARRITKLGLEQSSAQLLPEGSIVYSSRAPIGYIAIASNPLATNQGFKSIKFIRKGLEKYLYYALIAMTPEIIKMGSGTTFLEISGSLFSQVQLPLPPMAEQQRIVDALDKLLPLCEEIMQL
jgi:type I restriction enzyme S subunit